MYKIGLKLITILAVNVLAWDFFVTQIFILAGFYWDSDILFYGQIVTIIASILAWLWIHYSSKKEIAEAERYEL
jgi:hypothetical protein